jgi:hypothetical protein
MNAAFSHHIYSRFAALAVTLLSLLPVSAKAQEVIHRVVGSGINVIPDNFFPGVPGFSFRQSISAWQTSDGIVGGTLNVTLYGLAGQPVNLVFDITVLEVAGSTARFGGVLIHKNLAAYDAKIGSLTVGFISDKLDSDPDSMWSGPAEFFGIFDGEYDGEPLLMPDFPISSGNFIVR